MIWASPSKNTNAERTTIPRESMFVISCLATVLDIMHQEEGYYIIGLAIRTIQGRPLTVSAMITPMEGRIDVPEEGKNYEFLGAVTNDHLNSETVEVQQLLLVVKRGPAPGIAQATVTRILGLKTAGWVDVFYWTATRYGEVNRRVVGDLKAGSKLGRQAANGDLSPPPPPRRSPHLIPSLGGLTPSPGSLSTSPGGFPTSLGGLLSYLGGLPTSSPPTEVSLPPPEVSQPLLEVSSPTLEVSSPTLEVSSPTLEVSSPTLEVSSPTLEVSSPTLEVSSPTLEVSSPTLEVSPPPPPPPEISPPPPEVSQPLLEVSSPTLAVSLPPSTF
ncbi:hypothetical protein DFS34DRAFT_692086 [Phlyctochytrium arcticum]|nr:hypothetical protein DFS34DRAFT_692086 [Phlyctochytrium arcticum]